MISRNSRRPLWHRLLVALVSVAVAIALRRLLDPVLGNGSPFITLFAAVPFAAWFGGLGAGLLAVLAGIMGSSLWLLAPYGVLMVAGVQNVASLVMFACVSTAMVLFIHARQRAHVHVDAAREAERTGAERLALALDAGHMGVWEWDLATDGLWWSETLGPLHGLAPGAFPRTLREYQELIHPEDRARLAEAVSHALATRGEYDLEFRVVWPDGSVHRMNGKGRVQMGPDGRPGRMVGVGVDVTERHQAAEALQQSESRFARVVDHAPAAIFVKDATGRYATVNRVFEQMAGMPREKILGQGDDLLFPPEVAARFVQQDAEVRATGEARQYEDTFDYGGRSFTFLIVKFPLSDGTGRPNAICGIATDITDRKRAEAELAEAAVRKDVFLATLAHELRNPLAPIRTGLEIVRVAIPAASAGPAGRAVEIIDRQVRQMVRLVDDLLDVNRISRGKMPLQRERLSIERVLDSAVETVRPLLDARGHRLTMELPSTPLEVMGDLTRLAQVFGNLVGNAARYTPPGGRVSVRALRDGANVRVDVEDTGIGIDPAERARLFEMFSQVEAPLDRGQGGLGIGLALARGLVEMHGGTMEALSEGRGHGSTFTVLLPAAAEQAVAAPAMSTPLLVELRPLRVLVVDDNRDAAESLATLLRLGGHRVDEVHDGEEAVTAAADLSPEVVLLDIGMPRLNGYDAARRIRAEAVTLGRAPVLIAVTGWGQESDRQRAKDAGFDHHLTKPVDPSELSRVLAALTES